MQIQFTENDDNFWMDLTAENLQEAAQLTRFGLNRTNQLKIGSSHVDHGGSFTGVICIGKSKRGSGSIERK